MKKDLTEGTTRGRMRPHKGKLERPNRPPPSSLPPSRLKQEPRIEEIYCLKWKQTGNIPVLQGYIKKSRAYRHANKCNATLRPNFFQRLLGRYWVVATIEIVR